MDEPGLDVEAGGGGGQVADGPGTQLVAQADAGRVPAGEGAHRLDERGKIIGAAGRVKGDERAGGLLFRQVDVLQPLVGEDGRRRGPVREPFVDLCQAVEEGLHLEDAVAMGVKVLHLPAQGPGKAGKPGSICSR